ncbi:MAG: hypothetical protein ABA06_01470 [Parcubacteria bacterium C7867-001]|nr:MAG: hypothetical protein ABA06_01470 [Parcubacteria bacterium C7867-001]
MHKHHHSGENTALGFLLGAAVTATIGSFFLYGPEGQQRRKKMEKWFESVKEKTEEKVADVKDRVENAYEDVVEDLRGEEK